MSNGIIQSKCTEIVCRMVDDNIVSGISLGLVDGNHSFQYYYGKQGFLSPYNEHQLEAGLYYDLASLSKVIGTTTRIIQLIDEKEVSLTTKVQSILPQFIDSEVTIKDLLLHCGGLPAEIRDKKLWSYESIEKLLFTTSMESIRKKSFIYSDVGFILLGKIIEKIDTMTLEESYQKNIFIPLGMEHTSFYSPSDKLKCIPTECTSERGCICGEVHDKKALLIGPCGSAGLFSTLQDCIIFVEHYILQSQKLFSEKMFQTLQEAYLGRTLGWSKEYGNNTLYHTGFTGTSILIDMENQNGMILLSNRIHPSRDNLEFITRRKILNIQFLKNGV